MTVVSCRREDGRPQAAAARRAGLEEVRKVCDDLSETGPNRCLKREIQEDKFTTEDGE
jgi:hypothetical protein